MTMIRTWHTCQRCGRNFIKDGEAGHRLCPVCEGEDAKIVIEQYKNLAKGTGKAVGWTIGLGWKLLMLIGAVLLAIFVTYTLLLFLFSPGVLWLVLMCYKKGKMFSWDTSTIWMVAVGISTFIYFTIASSIHWNFRKTTLIYLGITLGITILSLIAQFGIGKKMVLTDAHYLMSGEGNKIFEAVEPDDKKKVSTTEAKTENNYGEIIDDNMVKIGGTIWQRGSGGSMPFSSAGKYCKKLSLSNYNDWRLPSISELKSIIVGCRSGTNACKASDDCLSTECFQGTPGACFCDGIVGPGENNYFWQKGVWHNPGDVSSFWSSSIMSDSSGYTWVVEFANGSVGFNENHKDSWVNVRCVREKTKKD